MSALPPIADMRADMVHVRFVPTADIDYSITSSARADTDGGIVISPPADWKRSGQESRERRPRSRRAQESGHRLDRLAAGENVGGESRVGDAQMVAQQALQHRTQVGGGLEVAVLVQIAVLKARPVRDHVAALERAAEQQRHRAGAVVGTLGAVDPRG